MSNTTADRNTFLDRVSEDYLSGNRNALVRPLKFDDIALLASGQGPSTFEAFRTNGDGDLVAVVVEVSHRHGAPSLNLTYAANDETGRLDRSNPVGARIRFTYRDGFGRSGSGFLLTTKAAEQASGHGSKQEKARKRIFLPLDSNLYTGRDVDTLAEPRTLPLAAVHGSEFNVSCVIADVSPVDLEARVRALIEREFGDTVGAIVKVDTNAVYGARVDVFDAADGRPLAVNVLSAEATYLMDGRLIETRPASTETFIVGR